MIKYLIRYECWRKKPSYDSQTYKLEINKLKEIKAEDYYERSEKGDLKKHVFHNDSNDNYEENGEENIENSPSIFLIILITKRYQRNMISKLQSRYKCMRINFKEYYRIKFVYCLLPLSKFKKRTSKRKLGYRRDSILSLDS